MTVRQHIKAEGAGEVSAALPVDFRDQGRERHATLVSEDIESHPERLLKGHTGAMSGNGDGPLAQSAAIFPDIIHHDSGPRKSVLGAEHQLRPDVPPELFLGYQFKFQRGFKKCGAFLVGVLGDPGRVVITDYGRKRGHQH